MHFFSIFQPTQKCPQMGSGFVFPTKPDLADILGDTDFDFDNFIFFDFWGSQLGPSLGLAWARLDFFSIFPAHAKMSPNGARNIFPTKPDLANILGDTDFDFDNFQF